MPTNEVHKLSKLVGLGLPSCFLQVELLRYSDTGVDVMATPDSQLPKPQCLHQVLRIDKVHVLHRTSHKTSEKFG